jgi:hypothetical protein
MALIDAFPHPRHGDTTDSTLGLGIKVHGKNLSPAGVKAGAIIKAYLYPGFLLPNCTEENHHHQPRRLRVPAGLVRQLPSLN